MNETELKEQIKNMVLEIGSTAFIGEHGLVHTPTLDNFISGFYDLIQQERAEAVDKRDDETLEILWDVAKVFNNDTAWKVFKLFKYRLAEESNILKETNQSIGIEKVIEKSIDKSSLDKINDPSPEASE